MIVGVDVSKDFLVYAAGAAAKRVANTAQGVGRLLRQLPPGAVLAMEATGRYHRLLADTACDRGLEVMVLNPRDVSRYRKSVSARAETDPIAARVIAEFAGVRQHRLYTPPAGLVDRIKTLVRTRASLVKQRVALGNQATQDREIATDLRRAIGALQRSVARLDQQLSLLAGALSEYPRLLQIPGFGQVVTPYLSALLRSGEFRRSDSFVAFLGLDLQFKDSGKRQGQRRLSKHGDPEARRLLYLAAGAACRQPGPFRELQLRCRARGLGKKETLVVVARKLARIAWALYTHQDTYRPERVLHQPSATQQADQPTPACPHPEPEAANLRSPARPDLNTKAIRINPSPPLTPRKIARRRA